MATTTSTTGRRISLEAAAEDFDSPVQYMQRTRDYYLRLGFDNPYRWSHYRDVPFAPLTKPIRDSRVTLITTAAPFHPGKGDQGPGAAYNSAAKFYKVYASDTSAGHDLRISHIGYDRRHTSAIDQRSWNPLDQLRLAAAEKRIGSLGPRFFGFPTNRSQATTVDVDAPELVRLCREDGIEAAVLVPNCPVCHQCVSIAARHLEAAGIATVVMGCAKDIVEHAGVPRFLFNDFPLGNGAGKPSDVGSQRDALALAFKLLETAVGPRTTLQNPQRWSDSADWKQDHLNLDRMPPEEVARRRADVDQQKEIARRVREDVGLAKRTG